MQAANNKPVRNVYYDVENTLSVPFITGIQRVTREFSKIVLKQNNSTNKFRYIPVIYDHKRGKWRQLDHQETKALLSSTPRSINIVARGTRKILQLFPKKSALYLEGFEKNSIFLDIESSWHSPLKRKELLPQLKQAGVKIAKLHYDIIPLLFPETTHPDTVNVFTEHFSSHLEHSDILLCISDTTLQDVTQYCVQAKIDSPTLTTIQLGSNIQFSDQSASLWPPNRRMGDFGQYLLTVGTVEPRKNYSLLVDAFNLIRKNCKLNLIIVGKVGWQSESILKKICDHSEYGTRIHHLDTVSDFQLGALYRNAWLNVIPSFYEGYGLPIVESLSRGCPTISSNAGSLREVGAGHVRFFSPYYAKELAEIIMELQTNTHSYNHLCRIAKNYSPKSWTESVKSIDQCLSTIK